jgi:hypothetical protein
MILRMAVPLSRVLEPTQGGHVKRLAIQVLFCSVIAVVGFAPVAAPAQAERAGGPFLQSTACAGEHAAADNLGIALAPSDTDEVRFEEDDPESACVWEALAVSARFLQYGATIATAAFLTASCLTGDLLACVALPAAELTLEAAHAAYMAAVDTAEECNRRWCEAHPGRCQG